MVSLGGASSVTPVGNSEKAGGGSVRGADPADSELSSSPSGRQRQDRKGLWAPLPGPPRLPPAPGVLGSQGQARPLGSDLPADVAA